MKNAPWILVAKGVVTSEHFRIQSAEAAPRLPHTHMQASSRVIGMDRQDRPQRLLANRCALTPNPNDPRLQGHTTRFRSRSGWAAERKIEKPLPSLSRTSRNSRATSARCRDIRANPHTYTPKRLSCCQRTQPVSSSLDLVEQLPRIFRRANRAAQQNTSLAMQTNRRVRSSPVYSHPRLLKCLIRWNGERMNSPQYIVLGYRLLCRSTSERH